MAVSAVAGAVAVSVSVAVAVVASAVSAAAASAAVALSVAVSGAVLLAVFRRAAFGAGAAVALVCVSSAVVSHQCRRLGAYAFATTPLRSERLTVSKTWKLPRLRTKSSLKSPCILNC